MKKKLPKKFIVKVQVSIIPQGQVMIYNEDQSIMYMEDMTEEFAIELHKKMKGELKAYFYAHTDKNKMISLDRLAPDQDW